MSKTIAEIFGLTPPKVRNFKDVAALENPWPSLLYGVELEIEQVNPDWVVPGFTWHEDGSLRNNGGEFVSAPMTYSNVVYAMDRLFRKNNPVERRINEYTTDVSSNYSERTSVHVHTNCQDITLEQLGSLCLLYETFERILFRYIGHNRDKSIFCVPWYETTLSHQIVDTFKNGKTDRIRHWQKYTSLNLLPLATQGSIEWRHMHGNADLAFISGWLRIIGWIYKTAVEKSFDEIVEQFTQLNTTSQYDRVMFNVFNQDTGLLQLPGYVELLEEGVLDMKYTLLKEPVQEKKNPFRNLSIDDILRAEAERQRIQAEQERRFAELANVPVAPQRQQEFPLPRPPLGQRRPVIFDELATITTDEVQF